MTPRNTGRDYASVQTAPNAVDATVRASDELKGTDTNGICAKTRETFGDLGNGKLQLRVLLGGYRLLEMVENDSALLADCHSQNDGCAMNWSKLRTWDKIREKC